jgi:mannose-1-phosphate guanylyltransferase/phosphomannomutase
MSAVATVALFYRQDVSASGVAVLGEEDRIRGFIEKPQMNSVPSHWVNAGVLVLEPQVLQFIPEDHPVDFGYDVLPALIAEGLPVFGYRMTEKLWWIDTPEAYEQVRLLGEKGGLDLK